MKTDNAIPNWLVVLSELPIVIVILPVILGWLVVAGFIHITAKLVDHEI